MGQVDTDRIERHLRALLEKERRDALAYAVLTVLGMPAFIVIASFLISLFVLAKIPTSSWNSATAIYIGFTGFLAYMKPENPM